MLNKAYLILILISIIGGSAFAQDDFDTIVFKGIYRDRDVTIDDSECEIQRVFANDKLIITNAVAGGRKVIFGKNIYVYADSLNLKVIYKKGGLVKLKDYENILLEEVDIDEFKLTEHGAITFRSFGEVAPLHYYVESYLWDKWVKIDTVDGSGIYDQHTYQRKVTLHPGENTLRLRRPNFSTVNEIVSDTLVVNNPDSAPLKIKTGKRNIEFSRSVYYELFDPYGKKVANTYGWEIRLPKEPNGMYYLNYENKQVKFYVGSGKISFSEVNRKY